MMPISKIHRALVVLVTVGLMPMVSMSQTSPDIGAAQRQAEILQRQEQERLQREQDEIRRRNNPVDGLDTRQLQPKIEVPELGVICHNIKIVSISSAPNLSAAMRQRITDEFTGRCLNVNDIERILGEITKYYIDRGFITTRAYLPQQDLSSGQLDILVMEGVIEKITINDGDAKSISIGNAFPGREGKLLNLRDLEQGIDQINRLPSNNARLDIQPGDKPGGSTVVINNKPTSPFRVSLATDNQGSVSTGAAQTAVTLSADNLLYFNESLSVTHRQSLPNTPGRKYSASDGLNFSIPFGYSTLSLGANRLVYFSPIALASGQELITSGSSKSENIRLDRVVYRGQSTRASVASTLTTKDSKNYLGTIFLDVSSRKLTVLDLDARLNTGFLGGVLALDLGVARGLTAMDALRDAPNLPATAPRAQFSKLKSGFSYAKPFRALDTDVTWTSQMTAQKANNVLYGSEQISIGGLFSVRGYVRNFLTGDDGYYWRNELSVRQPLTLGKETISSRIYAGYDRGYISNRVPGAQQGKLEGMVAGISVNWRGASWDFFHTRPITMSSTMVRETGQTWFRLGYSF
jgi:hemolysin activation/secretion protein